MAVTTAKTVSTFTIGFSSGSTIEVLTNSTSAITFTVSPGVYVQAG